MYLLCWRIRICVLSFYTLTLHVSNLLHWSQCRLYIAGFNTSRLTNTRLGLSSNTDRSIVTQPQNVCLQAGSGGGGPLGKASEGCRELR
jgi:hypothetical protein